MSQDIKEQLRAEIGQVKNFREPWKHLTIQALESAIARIEALERKLADLRQAPDGYFCAIAEADFELDTVTLKMEPGYRVRAGRHMLVPLPAAPSAGQAKSEGDQFAAAGKERP